MEKYTSKQTPDRFTLRKNYVSVCYDETIIKIKSYVENKNIWVSINETTDATGSYVANNIIGTLEINNMGKLFFIKFRSTRKNQIQHNLTKCSISHYQCYGP